MRFSDAFRKAVFHFKLKGSDLAEWSRLTPSQISDFRNGKNLRIDSVEKILEAMPQEARDYMLMLVAESYNEEAAPPQEEHEQH